MRWDPLCYNNSFAQYTNIFHVKQAGCEFVSERRIDELSCINLDTVGANVLCNFSKVYVYLW